MTYERDLGSLFAEARRRKELSLDEIAEIIHIKAEYLKAIEEEKFDFNLPDIYRRGFYKSYADFLSLNLEDVMAKCPVKSFETLESSRKRREMVSQVAKKTQEVNLEKMKTSFSDDVSDGDTPQDGTKFSSMNRARAMKMAGIIGGTILLVVLLLYMIVGTVSSRCLSPVEMMKPENLSESVEKRVTVRAKGDVKVMVRSEGDRAKLFSGTIQKGSEQVITYKTPIQIFFDRGEFLVIELANGEVLHPDSGRGGIQIK
jgi:DNA-binding XRE family transcriptional regulator